MDRQEVTTALRELARAAGRLALLLAGEAVEEPAATDAHLETEPWTSPTREMEPVVVHGEEDLEAALGRGHGALVQEGNGSLAAIRWSDVERLRNLAVALAGDVALEAAHAGVRGSRSAVDAMLRRAFEALTTAAEDCGLAAPAAEFVAAAARFSELDSRSGEWR